MSSFYCFRHERILSSELDEKLFVFCGRSRFDPEQFATKIEEEIQTRLMPDTVLVVVMPGIFKEVERLFAHDETINACMNRLGKTTGLELASFDKLGNRDSSKIFKGDPRKSTMLAEFARPGITNIFNKNGGFVEATDTYHFVNPSGRHTKRFIRLSNILADSSEIAFIAFCCIRYIGDLVNKIFIDTPSLFAVTAAINEYRRSFGQEPVDVENFHSYDGSAEIENPWRSALVLISASSSGGLARKMEDTGAFDNRSLVHLLYLGEQKCAYPVVCDLSTHTVKNPEGVSDISRVHERVQCQMCRDGSFVVHLKGDQFDVSGPQPEPILIMKSDAPRRLPETISRVAGSGALSIRPAASSSSRGRYLFVDTNQLLQASSFNQRMKYLLRRVVPSSTSHVITVDSSSRQLSQAVVDHIKEYGGECMLLNASEIEKLSNVGDSTLVIVAAAIESGRCLTDISRDLRSVAPDSPQVYFVGMEKTTAFPRREALKKTLVQCAQPILHEMVSVETMVLPSSTDQNAWDEELDFLQTPTIKETLELQCPTWYEKRIQILQSSSTITDNLFIEANSGSELSLQHGFVFWPDGLPSEKHSQADVYYTVSSVVQRLRANATKPGESHALKSRWFHHTIIDPANFVRFNDDIIQASLLRACKRSELNFRESPHESRQLARILKRIVSACDKPRGGAAPEFLLALLTGRVGLRPDDYSAVIEIARNKTGLVGAFAASAKKFL